MVAFRAWFVGIKKCSLGGQGTVGTVCGRNGVSINVGYPNNPTRGSSVKFVYFQDFSAFRIKQRNNTDRNVLIHFLLYNCRFWHMRWAIILDNIIAEQRRKIKIGTGNPVS